MYAFLLYSRVHKHVYNHALSKYMIHVHTYVHVHNFVMLYLRTYTYMYHIHTTCVYMYMYMTDTYVHVYTFFQILLPCSMRLVMTGPLNEPAMNINGVVEHISLTLSPSVVRLVVYAITTLIPKKVKREEQIRC